MRAIKLQTHVDRDHIVRLKLPEDVQEGPAEVIVLVPEAASDLSRPSLGDFLSHLALRPRKTRSKEEIDRDLEQERASWE
jgi:hypothetical protein